MTFRWLSGTLDLTAGACRRASQRLDGSPHGKALAAWRRADGDKTLRLDYDLTEDSVVFDVGGYLGQWTSDIFSRYCCRVYCFEPVRRFAERIAARFSRNGKVRVFPFGLAAGDRRERISQKADGSSVYRGWGGEEIELVQAARFIQQHQIKRIDLMKVNIEGAEYELIEHLLQTGVIRSIVDLQVQFHNFMPGAIDRVQKIRRQLAQTHSVTYQYDFVWENWRLTSK
jgi:FkbM family methyltransferase